MIVSLALGASALSADDARVLPPEGIVPVHTGAVTAVRIVDADHYLTAGNDGYIIVRNLADGSIESRFQASRFPIPIVSVSPDSERIAVVESDGVKIFRFSVWDWKTGKRIYTRDLSDAPVSLAFSPKGNLIAAATESVESLSCFLAATGNRLPFTVSATNGVSFAAISGSEKNVVAYSKSGSLAYWNLENGMNILNLKAPSNLSDSRLLLNNRFLEGTSQDSVTLVDVATGRVVDTKAVVSPLVADVPFDSSVLPLVAGPIDDRSLMVCTITATGLVENFRIPLKGLGICTAAALEGSTVILGNDDGTAYRVSLDDRSISPLPSSNILKARDLALEDGSLFLLTGDSIVSLDSDFFTNPEPKPVRKIVELGEIESPRMVYGDGSFFLYGTAKDGRAQVKVFDAKTGSPSYGLNLQSPPLAISVADGRFLILDSSGTIKVYDSANGTEVFSYTGAGLQSAVLVDASTALIGKSRSGLLRSSLLKIDMKTGETAPIVDDTNLITFKIVRDRETGNFLTLGIDEKSPGTTVAKRYSPAYGFLQVIYSSPDENVGAAIVEDGSAVYTTLGNEGAVRIDGKETKFFPDSRLPTRLAVSGKLLYALTTDGSLTVFDEKDGSTVATLYLANDGTAVCEDSSGVTERF